MNYNALLLAVTGTVPFSRATMSPEHDEVIRRYLRLLPVLDRSILTRSSGLWTGLRWDYEVIAEIGGISPDSVRASTSRSIATLADLRDSLLMDLAVSTSGELRADLKATIEAGRACETRPPLTLRDLMEPMADGL